VRRAGAGGDDGDRLNIEIKVEAGAPQETAPREQFVQVTVDAVRRADLLRKVSIQSFDWGALRRVREVEPRLPIVALLDPRLLQSGQPGASPWLGGLDIDDFGGDPVRAATSFNADALSPVHGDPQDGSLLDPGYRPYTTAELVDAAHAAGMGVIPWTVDDVATMNGLIDMHVDGIITDSPTACVTSWRSGVPPSPGASWSRADRRDPHRRCGSPATGTAEDQGAGQGLTRGPVGRGRCIVRT
jgi:glycerophosphoryl diester phosphodiesterase